MGLLLGGFAMMVILGPEAETIMNSEAETLGVAGRQKLRLAQSISHLLSFSVSSFVIAWLAYAKGWFHALGLRAKVDQKGALYAVLLVLLSLPVVALVQYLNLQIELPEWASQQELSTNKLVESILTYEQPGELLLLFITIAVVPAIGEELLLRGVIQGRVLPLFMKNVHLQVWLTAFLFGLMHLEFGGILPRAMLGAVFGYAYLWSRSIWVPIVLHFLFNGLQAAVVIYSGEFVADTEISEAPNWSFSLIALLAAAAVFYWGQSHYNRQQSLGLA